MRNGILVVAWMVVTMGTGMAAPTATGAPTGDACALLTPEQVGSAVGATMGKGTYPSPGFTKTCTWTTKGVIVTLMLEAGEMFQAAKHPPAPVVQVTPESGIGDEAFFQALTPNVYLHVKKGSAAFKASVYSSAMSMDKKKAIEKTLAQEVVGKL
jgi:hypothetical protein